MLVKAVIWAISLGSGTSGGVLAPLLMMGSALGVLESPFLPATARVLAAGQHGGDPGRHDARAADRDGVRDRADGAVGMALPLLTAGVVAHGFTVLALRRSILTEKVARRVPRQPRVRIDPLEILSCAR